ncbi:MULTISPECIES: hypothetical protein [unclassified Bradyrhizobium]|nr:MULTISPECIES: hypothetical protein [unclassified Bradyrhizobium]
MTAKTVDRGACRKHAARRLRSWLKLRRMFDRFYRNLSSVA